MVSNERLNALIGVMSKLPGIGEFDSDVVAALRELVQARAEIAELRRDAEQVERDVRWIHQKLKRGEATQDHGLAGNLACIIDHLADAAAPEPQE